MKSITVTLVGKHRIFLDGLLALLSNQKDLQVLHASIHSKLSIPLQPAVDVLILESGEAEEKELRQIESLKKIHPTLKVLLIYMGDFNENLHRALDVADGCLFGGASGSEFLHAIKEILKNRTYLSPEVMPLILEKYQRKEMSSIAQQFFSEREKEVLEMVALDKSNDEIAHVLCISKRTVETHRKNMMSKANVRTVVGLIRYGISHELIAI